MNPRPAWKEPQLSLLPAMKADLAQRVADMDALSDVDRWLAIVAAAWDVLDDHRVAAAYGGLWTLVQEYAHA